MPAVRIAKGDTVIHTGKPEWGPGEVLAAEGIKHEGKSAQRVTVRFARSGLKTLSTAFASLRLVDSGATTPRLTSMPSTSQPPKGAGHPPQDQFSSVEQAAAEGPSREAAMQALLQLPEEATDPFLPLVQRVRATLGLYRYMDSPGGLMDWAVTHTGMRDPLALFSRHDLEAAFDRFRIAADNHLRKVLPQARKSSHAEVESLLGTCGPAARQAVRRADVGR